MSRRSEAEERAQQEAERAQVLEQERDQWRQAFTDEQARSRTLTDSLAAAVTHDGDGLDAELLGESTIKEDRRNDWMSEAEVQVLREQERAWVEDKVRQAEDRLVRDLAEANPPPETWTFTIGAEEGQRWLACFTGLALGWLLGRWRR